MVPIKVMQGTPWYTIPSNKLYSIDFYYVGANVKNRDWIIEDRLFKDDFDPILKELKSCCSLRRVEQSDLIFIMLNLSFIPD